MVIINTIDDKNFSLDGIQYAKIYQPLAQGSEAIGIYNVFDTSQQLKNSTDFNQYSIDGVIYTSQSATVAALLAVTYSIISVAEFEALENRVDNLEENQVTGVEVYSTYADLPTTGTPLVSYKVANDPSSSSNNGFYHWDGSTYTKDAELVSSEILETNTSQGVSGEAVYNFNKPFATIRNGYNLTTRGNVLFDEIHGILTIDNNTFITSKDGKVYTLEAGDGIGFDLIDNFEVAPAINAHLLYVDIEIGSISQTIELKTAVFSDAIFTTLPDLSIERIILGTAYLYNNVYLLQFAGISDNIKVNLIDAARLVVYGNNASMLSPNDWSAGIGTPTFDTNITVANKMFIDFTAAANEQVILAGNNKIGSTYKITLKARLNSGSEMPIRLGAFVSTISGNAFDITPTSTESSFVGTYIATSEDISIGSIASNNLGSDIEISDFKVELISKYDALQDTRITALESNNIYPEVIRSFGTENFIQSISKYDKPLTKIGIVGDSLMGNDIGGAIPITDDEGATMRPIRMDINNIPRRIYDNIKFNPATHRRVDSADWTKSGTWLGINNTTVWEPIHSDTKYYYSIVPSSYLEIDIPNGHENFAFICQKRENAGVLNITLNGGSIAAYGNSSVDLDRVNDSLNDIGNPYHTEQYLNLPAGINTIRISKEANTDEVRVWGGFHWAGNTIIVHNVAHGGHDMSELISDHLTAEVIENNFDAILFEITIMNEASHGRTVEASSLDLINIIDNYFTGKDLCIMTTNPFGDNGAGTNYYVNFPDPSMEDFTDSFRPILYTKAIPFIDVFNFFKLKIENRGGTLVGGEGGLYYTDDGQHPNEDGCREWFNLIRFIFENKPIKWE